MGELDARLPELHRGITKPITYIYMIAFSGLPLGMEFVGPIASCWCVALFPIDLENGDVSTTESRPEEELYEEML